MDNSKSAQPQTGAGNGSARGENATRDEQRTLFPTNGSGPYDRPPCIRPMGDDLADLIEATEFSSHDLIESVDDVDSLLVSIGQFAPLETLMMASDDREPIPDRLPALIRVGPGGLLALVRDQGQMHVRGIEGHGYQLTDCITGQHDLVIHFRQVCHIDNDVVDVEFCECCCDEFARHWDCRHVDALIAAGIVDVSCYTPHPDFGREGGAA